MRDRFGGVSGYRLGLLGLWVSLASCGHPVAGPAKNGDASVGPQPSSLLREEARELSEPKGTSAPVARAVGDPIVLEAARRVLGCEWHSDGPMAECKAAQDWIFLKALEEGKSDATLIALFDDPDPKMQSVACLGLDSGGGKQFRADRAMAEKVFAKADAAQGTQTFLVCVARLAGKVNADKTGLGERMKGLAKTLQPKEARKRFIESAQFFNQELMYETTVSLAKGDPDPDIRYEAAGSLWLGAPRAKDEAVCQLWSDIAHESNAEDRLTSHAAGLALHTARGCPNVYGPLLRLLDQKSKETMATPDWVTPLYLFVQNEKPTDALRSEGMRILKVIAQNPSNGASARARAIEGVARGDKKKAKAWLAKFKNERSESLVESVESIEAEIEKELAQESPSK